MGASLSERVILPFDVWFYGIAQTANCKHLAALCQCVFDYADYAIEIIYIRLYIYMCGNRYQWLVNALGSCMEEYRGI